MDARSTRCSAGLAAAAWLAFSGPAAATSYRGSAVAKSSAHAALQAGKSDFVCKVTLIPAKKKGDQPGRQMTTRGLSLFDHPDQLGNYKATIFEVESLPHDLTIEQRGNNKHHFEIVVTDCAQTGHPDAAEYQHRLDRVVLKDVTPHHP